MQEKNWLREVKELVDIGLSLKEHLDKLQGHYYLNSFAFHLM